MRRTGCLRGGSWRAHTGLICRTQSVQSQCARRKLALGLALPEQHQFARTRKALTLRQTYFVNNVTASGHTSSVNRFWPLPDPPMPSQH
jgi:hypothetical protein